MKVALKKPNTKKKQNTNRILVFVFGLLGIDFHVFCSSEQLCNGSGICVFFEFLKFSLQKMDEFCELMS